MHFTTKTDMMSLVLGYCYLFVLKSLSFIILGNNVETVPYSLTDKPMKRPKQTAL